MTRRHRLLRLVYVLVLLAGVVTIYLLVPTDVWRAMRGAYWKTEAE